MVRNSQRFYLSYVTTVTGHWYALTDWGMVERCPECNTNISLLPMNIDEVCSIQYDDKRGVTITFDRKKPMR